MAGHKEVKREDVSRLPNSIHTPSEVNSVTTWHHTPARALNIRDSRQKINCTTVNSM